MADFVQEEQRQRITAAEFYALPEDDERRELLGSEVITMPTPIPLHQRVVRLGTRVLEKLIPNGEIFFAPLELYLDDDNIPQPDIMWVAENSRCQVTPKRLEGPPELIVEVLSPGTARTDRVKKFRLYERFAVREYWLIDPAEGVIEVYTHDGSGYIRLGGFEAGETFASLVLGGAQVAVNALLVTQA